MPVEWLPGTPARVIGRGFEYVTHHSNASATDHCGVVLMRLARSEIRITVTEEDDGRLLVSLAGPAFAEVLADYKAHFVPSRLSVWCPEQKRWSMPVAVRERLESWLEQTVDPACVRWDAEPTSHTYSSNRTGRGRYHHQGRGRPSSTALVPPLESALARLHLRPEAPVWAAEAVFRAAIRRAHPDHGGNHATACALTEAISLIREHDEKSA
jgi:hypothetical protein